MINWKNTAENLGLVIIAFLVGATVGYFASTFTAKAMIDQMIPTIEKAIDKETIKNEIRNDIILKDNKFKKNDSLNININQIPANNQKPVNVVVKKKDSIPVKRKGFFGRLFSKN
jgi:proteasome assembly chaperone (PAC2) family protein